VIRVVLAALVALVLTVADDKTPVPGFFDLDVTGRASAYGSLGFLPEERAHALVLIARQVYSQSGSSGERSAARRLQFALSAPAAAGSDESPRLTIAAPLSADAWRDLLELPRDGDLFAALIGNRPALLTASGAMTTDATIRALLERDRGLLRWIARNASGTFCMAGRSLRVAGDRIAVPGGAGNELIWEALAGERVTRPADFIRALLMRDAGRLAWFYDTIASLSDERRRDVLPPSESRLDHARALYAAFKSPDPNWRVDDHPYLRGVADASLLTSLTAVNAHPPRCRNGSSTRWSRTCRRSCSRIDSRRRRRTSQPSSRRSPVRPANRICRTCRGKA
jgi:hypothetical protein